nr:lactosylceramide 4-alpha-galactosyltransferase-like [Procambarus clarkii]
MNLLSRRAGSVKAAVVTTSLVVVFMCCVDRQENAVNWDVHEREELSPLSKDSKKLQTRDIVTPRLPDWGESPGVAGRGTWVPHLCPRYGQRGQRSRLEVSSRDFEAHLKLTWTPPDEGTIFFTQTSCSTFLSAREACAVESAAHHHPQRLVLVLMTAPAVNQTHPLMQVLSGLRSVRLAWLDLDEVFSEEPLRTWHRDRVWVMGEDRVAWVVSDAARVEVLRRYGGTYLDLDFITLRALPRSTNWLARIHVNLVNGGILSFSSGHPFLQAVVADIPSVFDPGMCCSIGPDLITQHLHRRCPDNVTIPASVTPDQFEICGDITVWPTKLFYPIPYGYPQFRTESIFTEGMGIGAAFFSSTKAVSLHLTHSLTHNTAVSVAGDSILKEAAVRNCPRVVEALKTHNMDL